LLLYSGNLWVRDRGLMIKLVADLPWYRSWSWSCHWS